MGDLCKHLHPQGSQPGIMYELSKIHKPLGNGFPNLRPILSAINAGTYKWTVKDSFDFVKEITQQRSKLFLASLDEDSLFTSMSLDETTHMWVNKLFKYGQTVSGHNKQQISEMLSLTTTEKILFDQKYYNQIDGVAIGFLLGPTLANIFLCYHRTMWLKNCPKSFKPVYLKHILMTFLFYLKNWNKFYDLLII